MEVGFEQSTLTCNGVYLHCTTAVFFTCKRSEYFFHSHHIPVRATVLCCSQTLFAFCIVLCFHVAVTALQCTAEYGRSAPGHGRHCCTVFIVPTGKLLWELELPCSHYINKDFIALVSKLSLYLEQSRTIDLCIWFSTAAVLEAWALFFGHQKGRVFQAAMDFHSQIASIMEVLANAAVAEICKVVDDGYAVVHLEMSRSQKENEFLRRKIKLLELQVARYRAERVKGAEGSISSRFPGVRLLSRQNRDSLAGM